jgi:hypothetical protein
LSSAEPTSRTTSTEPAEARRDGLLPHRRHDPKLVHEFMQPRAILLDVLDQPGDRRPRRLVRLGISSAPRDVDGSNRPCEVIAEVCRKPSLQLGPSLHLQHRHVDTRAARTKTTPRAHGRA